MLTVVKDISGSLKISVPLIITYLVTAAGNFVAVIFVAKLGHSALAASALALGIYSTVMVFSFGFVTVISVLVAQNFGANQMNEVGNSAAHGAVLSLLLGIIMFLLVCFSPAILVFSSHDAVVINYATSYLHALAWAILPLTILMALQQVFMGVGKTNLVMWLSIIEAPLEIGACFLLVFGKFGLPKLGIIGLGYGFAVIFALMICCYLFLLLRPYSYYRFFPNLLCIEYRRLWELICLGFPLGVAFIVVVVTGMVIAFMMAHFGTANLAAFQIARQFAVYVAMIALGISQAVTIQVGQAVGRSDVAKINYLTRINIWSGFVILLSVSVVFILFPQSVISLDINVHAAPNQLLFAEAALFLIFVVFIQIMELLRYGMTGALRGMKDTKVPMFITVFAYWFVGLPTAYLLGFKLDLDGVGLWLGMLIGVSVCAALLVMRFRWLVIRAKMMPNLLQKC